MPELKEHWIEIDDEHVKHVQETTYTKTELATRLSVFIRPEPAVITRRGIDSETKELEQK